MSSFFSFILSNSHLFYKDNVTARCKITTKWSESSPEPSNKRSVL